MRKRKYLVILSVLFVFFLISTTVKAAGPNSDGGSGSRSPGGGEPGDDDDDDSGGGPHDVKDGPGNDNDNGGSSGEDFNDDGNGPDHVDGNGDDGSNGKNTGDGYNGKSESNGSDGNSENKDDSDMLIGTWSMDSMEIGGLDYFGNYKRAILAFKLGGIEIEGVDYSGRFDFDTATLIFESDEPEMDQQVDEKSKADTAVLIKFDTATIFTFESDGTYKFSSTIDSSLGTWEIKNNKFYMISSEISGPLFGNRPSDMDYNFSDGDTTLTLYYTMILNDNICSIKIVLKKMLSESNSDNNGDIDGDNESSDGFGRFNNYIEYLRFLKLHGKLYSKNEGFYRYDFNILTIGYLLCSECNSDSDGESDSDESISDSDSKSDSVESNSDSDREADSDDPNGVSDDPIIVTKTNEVLPTNKEDEITDEKYVSSESDLKIVQKEEIISTDNTEDGLSDEMTVPTEAFNQQDDSIIKTNDNSIVESDLVNNIICNPIIEESEVVASEKDSEEIVEKYITPFVNEQVSSEIDDPVLSENDISVESNEIIVQK